LPLVTVNTSAFVMSPHRSARQPNGCQLAHRTALLKGAERIAVDARAKASWSTRIPGSVEVKALGSRISVTADAPNAAPLENRGKEGEFKHPVFGTLT